MLFLVSLAGLGTMGRNVATQLNCLASGCPYRDTPDAKILQKLIYVLLARLLVPVPTAGCWALLCRF